MNLFASMLKKESVLEIEDQVFGSITFEQGVWCTIPKNFLDGFTIIVDAPQTGPSQAQRDFFHKIQTNLVDLEGKARDYIESLDIPNINVSNLSVYSMEIGNDHESKNELFVLEMSEKVAREIHRVSFSGGVPVNYACDD